VVFVFLWFLWRPPKPQKPRSKVISFLRVINCGQPQKPRKPPNHNKN
jgi:hypothetical protein